MFTEEQLIRASQGKSKTAGGLNVPDIIRYLQLVSPREDLHRQTRSNLNDLLASALRLRKGAPGVRVPRAQAAEGPGVPLARAAEGLRVPLARAAEGLRVPLAQAVEDTDSLEVLRRQIQARRGVDSTPTLKNLISIAKSWIGKGNYIQDSNSIISSNYPHFPPYLFADFKILFVDNWSIDEALEHRLKQYSLQKYKNMTLRMNCWEFALLCLYESGYITNVDIAKLYNHHHNSLRFSKLGRIPDFFNLTEVARNPDTLVPGHIILYYRTINNKVLIWHASIAISTTEMVSCIGTGVVISKSEHRLTVEEGIYMVDPHKMLEHIVALPPIKSVMSVDMGNLKLAIKHEPALKDLHKQQSTT
jgi:hypothetical protein